MEVAIIGAGVGGLTLALSLLNAGIRNIHIYEASKTINAVEDGINIQPQAMQTLAHLGLLDELLHFGVITPELHYYTQQGQLIWKESRDVSAGYHSPQISINRKLFIKILHQAVVKRLGANHIHTNTQLKDLQQHNNGSVTAIFDSGVKSVDCLVACDGVHSRVRRKLYPREAAPKWNGITMWRGVSRVKPFIKENAMIIAGQLEHRMVVSPLAQQPDVNGNILISWTVKHKTINTQTMPKQDWTKQVKQDEVPDYFQNFEFLNYTHLLNNALAIYKYPQVDRTPLPNWNFGNVTLLGDAAHPVCPSVSTSISQAIIDAQCLADQLSEQPNIETAIAKYDSKRRLTAEKIVLSNKQNGPEKCIDIVQKRAPNGFTLLADVIDQQELSAIASA